MASSNMDTLLFVALGAVGFYMYSKKYGTLPPMTGSTQTVATNPGLTPASVQTGGTTNWGVDASGNIMGPGY